MSDFKLFIELLLETMNIGKYTYINYFKNQWCIYLFLTFQCYKINQDIRYPFNTYDDLKEVQKQLFKKDTYNLTGHCIVCIFIYIIYIKKIFFFFVIF